MKFIHIVSGNASPHTIRSIISNGAQEDNDKIAFKKVCRCQTTKGHVTTYLIVDWSDMWNITWKSFLGVYDFSTRLNFVCNLKINVNILFSFKNNVLFYQLIFLLTFMLRSFLLYSNFIWRIGSVKCYFTLSESLYFISFGDKSIQKTRYGVVGGGEGWNKKISKINDTLLSRQYASSEFRRNYVPLWVLFRKWGIKGVC